MVCPSVLDRPSLIQLARSGGGEYFEIGRGSDRDVAFGLISRLRQRSNTAQVVESFDDLYWQFLLAAGIVLCIGALLLRRRVDSYVFQDMTVVEIVESVFADYAPKEVPW